MEYQYGTTTYDLRELPPSLHARIGEEQVVTALHAYLDAYTADKAAIEENDAYDAHVWSTPTDQAGLDAHWNRVGQLIKACTLSRKQRKSRWYALLDVLGEDYSYTSTDEEDFD